MDFAAEVVFFAVADFAAEVVAFFVAVDFASEVVFFAAVDLAAEVVFFAVVDFAVVEAFFVVVFLLEEVFFCFVSSAPVSPDSTLPMPSNSPPEDAAFPARSESASSMVSRKSPVETEPSPSISLTMDSSSPFLAMTNTFSK